MKKKHFFIKKSSAIAWVVASVMMTLPLLVVAQEASPAVYALVEYMKVKQGDGQKYTDLERNYWKKIHQERVKKGEIVRWALYVVRFAGSDDEYNYVTATILSNPNKLENPYEGIDAAKILAGEDVDKIMNETAESRQLVKSNLIRMVSSVNSESGPSPFKYVQIDFMKVKPENDARYLDVENKVWRPVHQQFIKDGSRVGWTLWQTVYPSGAGMEYQYATSNYISDFSKLMSADYNKAFTAAHPGGNTDKLMEDTDKSRDLVRSELWQLLDITE
jgi:hypothetical protein